MNNTSNNNATTAMSPSSEFVLFQALVVALAVLAIGPFALIGAAGLAALATVWRRVWLWPLTVFSSLTAVVLWPFVHLHICLLPRPPSTSCTATSA